MKKIFSILLITISMNMKSQTIKTYNGTFENGNAIYEYYENADLERIYHGKFNYHASVNSIRNSNIGIENNKITVSGSYKENLKEGIWNYSDIQYLTTNEANNIKKTIVGKYTNGQKQGKWIYNFITNAEGKSSEQKIELLFKNNILIGRIEFLNKISGNIDSSGKLQGSWKLTLNKDEYNAEIKDGYIIKLIVRQKETGEILLKYFQDPNFSTKKVTDEDDSNEEYSAEEIERPYNSNYIDNFTDYINNITSIDKPTLRILRGSVDFEIFSQKILEREK